MTDAASCGGGILRRVRLLLEGAQIESRSQDLLLALDVAVGGLVGVEVERLTAALVYDLRVLEYLDTHVSAFGHALHLSLEVGDLLVLTLELHILHIAIAMLLLLLVQISKLHAIVAVALRIRGAEAEVVCVGSLVLRGVGLTAERGPTQCAHTIGEVAFSSVSTGCVPASRGIAGGSRVLLVVLRARRQVLPRLELLATRIVASFAIA